MFFSQSLALLLAVGVNAAPALSPPSQAISTTVDLGYAKYQGAQYGDVKQWLGIRFAAPPLGDLRFRAPQPPILVSAVQDATTAKPVCVGTNVVLGPPRAGTTEDCLTLNVFTPANATTTSNLPVWFFIQGGGYSANSDANYNASGVIDRSGGNVIFVEINYRVGAFGFLASKEVQSNGALNAGFLDQRFALQWVQQNIAKFGGNPNHVVIHGDSAGAGSVGLHLVAYGGVNKNLFVGGLMESPYFPTERTVAELQYQYVAFVNLAGCSSASNTLSCLRSASSTTLQNASNNAGPYPGGSAAPFFPYAPTVDGVILTDYPLKLFKAGKFIKVPVMIGDDNDEGSLFVPDAASPTDVSLFIKNQFPNLTQANLSTVNTLYPLMTPMPGHSAYFPSLEQAYGESTFTCPGLIISSAISTFYDSSKVWNYRNNIQDPAYIAAGLGTPHVMELAALFDTGGVASFSTVNAPIVPVLKDLWTNFVRFLDPNGVGVAKTTLQKEGVPAWGNFAVNASLPSPVEQRLRLQTNATGMESVPQAQRQRCQFWSDLVPLTEA